MPRLKFSLRSVLILILLILQPQISIASNDFRVVTSIKPIHSILAGLMQGTEGPELLVAGKSSPFDYELTEQQKQGLKSADLVIWVGPELEKFLIEPVESLPSSKRVLTLLDNPLIKVLPSRWSEIRRDPFFWLDSRNVIILIDELTRVLMTADAARAHLYKRNRDAVFSRIAELDRKLEYGYRGLKSGVGIAYYDTLQYFEQAYALKIRGLVAQSPMHTIEAARLLDGRSRLAEGFYSCLIIESEMSMPDLPLLTGSSEIRMAELDSFGDRFNPGPDLYFQLMEHNTAEIKACLHHGSVDEKQLADAEVEKSMHIGGKFMLMDHNGRIVTEKDMHGKYQILLFGYTFCPDVCPTSLQVLSMAMNKLGDKADRIQPYFITVDPERDTVKVLQRYVGYFYKDLIGLTGSKSMVERVAKQFNVQYEKVLQEGADPDMYTMDHTASAYLMAPDGSFITKFAYGISPSQLVDKINEYVK